MIPVEQQNVLACTDVVHVISHEQLIYSSKLHYLIRIIPPTVLLQLVLSQGMGKPVH